MAGYTKAPTRYQFPLFDFGGGADKEFFIMGPKGRTGMLIDYGVVSIEEALNGDTLNPTVAVGTTTDPDAYGDEFTPTTDTNETSSSVRTSYNATADIEAVILAAGRALPADTLVVLTCAAATGANLTGQAYPFVEILWAD